MKEKNLKRYVFKVTYELYPSDLDIEKVDITKVIYAEDKNEAYATICKRI